MTAHNTSLGTIRTVIWQGRREGLIMDENPDGTVALIRSSDVDDGPSRSLLLQPGAIGPLAAMLWGLAVHRASKGLGQAMARASALFSRRGQ